MLATIMWSRLQNNGVASHETNHDLNQVQPAVQGALALLCCAGIGVADDALIRDACSADRDQTAGEPTAQHCI